MEPDVAHSPDILHNEHTETGYPLVLTCSTDGPRIRIREELYKELHSTDDTVRFENICSQVTGIAVVPV